MMRWLAMPILLVMIWQAGSVLFVTVVHQQAEDVLVQGFDTDAVHQQLLVAQRIDQSHPGTLLLLARTANDTEQSLVYLRQLTEIEPHNAQHWIALLQAKAGVHEFDDEVELALRNAATLGPFEPRVQLDSIRFGATHWLALNVSMRQMVIDAAERALKTHAPHLRRELLAVLIESGLLPVVCARGLSVAECEAD